MNKQFLKLAEQAGLTLSVDQQVAFQRAATLIVQECATLAYDGPGGILDHFGLADAPVDDVDRILQTVRTRGQQ